MTDSWMRLPMCFFIGASAVALPLLAACGPSQEQSQLSGLDVFGKMTYADGTPVSGVPVQYRITLGGTGLFTEGLKGCSKGDPHMQGSLTASAIPDSSGQFQVRFDLSQARSRVSSSCGINNLGMDHVDNIRLDTVLPANKSTCPKFCASEGSAASPSCESDCETGGRVLQASKTLDSADLQALFRKSGPTLAWPLDLSSLRLGPAASQGSGVDLVVDGDSAESSLQITHETFSPSDCAIVEQCVGGPGERTLLRFSGDIINLGNTDLVLGSPVDNPLFEYSACHDHYHLRDMMLYELLSACTGEAVSVAGAPVVGRKQGFCMMDMDQVSGSADSSGYTCDFQGLTAGWTDDYDSSLDCQWLDITGVPPGKYTLRITVNPDGIFAESDSSNNSTEIPVTIP